MLGMKNIIAPLAGAITCILAAGPVSLISEPVAAEEPKWHITGMDYAPLVFANESSDFTGTVGETVKALCKAGELSCKFERMPLKRSMHLLANGQLDASITIITGQPRPCCTPTDWQTPWTSGFFTNDDNMTPPETADALNGHALITVLGMKSPYSFAPDLDKMAADGRVTIFKGSSIKSSVDMFMAKRAPLLWGSADFAWHIQKHHADKKKPGFYPRLSFPMVLWVNNDRPDLLEGLNRGYRALIETGALDKDGLLKRYKPDS